MILGTADEALPGLRHHVVSVGVEVKGKRYLVTVEETWTRVTGVGASGIESYQEPKKATVDFETIDEFLCEARDIFDGWECREELEGIDEELLSEAMRSAEDQVRDVLLFGGAAHFDESSGGFSIDWDEVKCRRLIKKASQE